MLVRSGSAYNLFNYNSITITKIQLQFKFITILILVSCCFVLLLFFALSIGNIRYPPSREFSSFLSTPKTLKK